jgi:hypothetical protein
MTEEQKAKLEELSVIGRTLAGLRPAVRRAPRETENSSDKRGKRKDDKKDTKK